MPRKINYKSSRTITSRTGNPVMDHLGYGIECPQCKSSAGLLQTNVNAILLLRENEQHELVDYHIGLDSTIRCLRCKLTGTRRSFTRSWCVLAYTDLSSEREMDIYMPAGFIATLLQRPRPTEWAHGFLVASRNSAMRSYSWRPMVALRGDRNGGDVLVEVHDCERLKLPGGLVTFPGSEFLSSLEEMGYL